MIGICVDSNSQLPDSLAERFGIVVVPLTVTADGVDHLEGVDITVESFYGLWDNGHVPAISTSQPSPGRFAAAYEALAEQGATEILSIHVAEAMSGTLNAARLAAQTSPVPVTLVDSGTASFGITCCAWAAAEAVESGASISEAAAIAGAKSSGLGAAFIVGVPKLTQQSGRAGDARVEEAAEYGIPVLSLSGSDLAVLDTVATIDAAVSVMADYALGWLPTAPDGLRIAIGTSDVTSAPVSAALAAVLSASPALAEPVVHYSIGPSVGAHTGPGTAGLFVF